MIILEKLIFDNWFSYGDSNVIYFNKDNITQLTGLVGAGKSSIPLIIQEILYGKNSKGIKKGNIQNRVTKGTVRGELHFSDEEHKYVVTLVRKSTPTITVLCDSEDISGHTASQSYAVIQDIIGLDFKLFSQLTYQSSKNSLDFLTATDTNRKKFLINLFGLDRYVALFDSYKEAIRIMDKDIAAINGSIKTIEKWIQTSTNSDLILKEISSVPKAPEAFVHEKEELLKDLASIEFTNKEINRNNEYKEMLSVIDSGKLIPPDIQCKTDNFLPVQNRHNFLADKQRIATELAKIQKLGDKCHVCLQTIPKKDKEEYIQQLNDEAELVDIELDIVNNEIKEMTRVENLWAAYRKATKEFEDLSNYIDPNIAEELLDEESITEKIGKLSADISKVTKTIKDIEAKNLIAAKHNSKAATILEQLESYKESLKTNEEELVTLTDIASSLSILKSAFSTNGLISYKLQYLVQDLQSEITKYLIKLSDGRFELSFRLDNDKLNIKIYDNNDEIDIEALSSGEMAKVNIATLLAIRAIMSSISNTKLNILFLDESINTLDVQSRESLISGLLSEVQLNIFIMSHSWSHPLVHTLNITKSNGISKLEN